MAGYKVRRSGLVGDFAQSIFLNSAKIMEDVNKKVYQISRELFLRIVDLTPSPAHPGETAKGLLVNNWFPVDGPSFSSEKTSQKSPYGAGSIGRISALAGKQFLRQDGSVTLSNNLDYAYRAEVLGWPKEDGWSGRVGPYRMVAKSIQTIAAKYT